jgi:hypothetical protein
MTIEIPPVTVEIQIEKAVQSNAGLSLKHELTKSEFRCFRGEKIEQINLDTSDLDNYSRPVDLLLAVPDANKIHRAK